MTPSSDICCNREPRLLRREFVVARPVTRTWEFLEPGAEWRPVRIGRSVTHV
ncbi:hypothetical protein ACFWOX_12135 [Streptomyces sp. NPDC058467]|uniref:hypothetical protein n=1 Tax=Streptomyces sp. NPDC058467 TaxID=3346513 RepID=UPI003665BD3F